METVQRSKRNDRSTFLVAIVVIIATIGKPALTAGFKIAAGDSRHFGLPCRRFFTQEIEENDIPSLDRQNQCP